MSGIAAKELVKLGYTNISELAGGMLAREQAGLKVEKGQNPTSRITKFIGNFALEKIGNLAHLKLDDSR